MGGQRRSTALVGRRARLLQMGVAAIFACVAPAAAEPAQATPTYTVAPVTSGDPYPGETLACSDGEWSEPYTSITKYWWQDNVGAGTVVGTGDSYAVSETDLGHEIFCQVWVIFPHASGSGTSVTFVGAAKTVTWAPQVPGDPPPEQPQVSSMPVPTDALPPTSSSEASSQRIADRCGSKRRFAIRVRRIRGVKYRRVRVWVNGKPVRVVKTDRYRATVNLRHYPRGTFRVRIVVRTRHGRRFTGKRIYHTCHEKRLKGKRRRL